MINNVVHALYLVKLFCLLAMPLTLGGSRSRTRVYYHWAFFTASLWTCMNS